MLIISLRWCTILMVKEYDSYQKKLFQLYL